jgi:carboxyl-terminal processing protease
MLHQSAFARFVAAIFCLWCVAAAPAGALSPQLAQDVHQSYSLLVNTYYDPVNAQALLAAAADALAATAQKHGVTVQPPQLRVDQQTDATMAQLDNAIASVARAAHGDVDEYAYAAIEAMAKAVGDKYTQFFDPAEYRAFNDALDPERIGGIGVMIQREMDAIHISYVVPSTPAERAGLHVGDTISAVDGVSTKGMEVDAVSKMLRGKPGTVVAVAIERAGQQSQSYSITRAEVQPPTVRFSMLPGSIGYVAVMAFGRATPQEFDTAIARLRDDGAKAMVLDLRNDGGGYVNSALDISSRFIANKALLTVEERGHRAETIQADNDVSVTMPVTVLVNQYTASASEITAGALQDDGIGELIGTKTYGKGVMQTLTPLPGGSAIKITTAHYLTPSRRDINLRGIQPNQLVIENRDPSYGEIDKDAQLRAALIVLQKKIAEVPKAVNQR